MCGRRKMDNQTSYPTARPQRKGFAISSLVIGIASILTCGGLLVGAIAGIVLGIVALSKARSDPAQYAGKGLAIAGIVTSACSFFMGILVAIAIPNLLKSQQAAHETAALVEVQTIGKAQILYSVTKGKGSFADLRTLGALGLIDAGVASGEKGGYVFRSEPLSVSEPTPMFDTTAQPVEGGTFGTGNVSFYSNETMVVFQSDGTQPPTATPRDRVPKDGTPVE
jgi:type II secretory pathway pseudopilin PulG